jgi:hypothetical protein
MGGLDINFDVLYVAAHALLSATVGLGSGCKSFGRLVVVFDAKAPLHDCSESWISGVSAAKCRSPIGSKIWLGLYRDTTPYLPLFTKLHHPQHTLKLTDEMQVNQLPGMRKDQSLSYSKHSVKGHTLYSLF